MAADPDVVAQLERELLSPAVRADPARLAQLLHPSFLEIGASGRRWTREEMIAALVASPDADVDVDELLAEHVAPEVVLVTSRTRRGDAAARRSSLWVRVGGRWLVRFHQGTPIPPAP